MLRKPILLAGFILLSLTAARADSDYVASVQKWRNEEEADLKKPDGWLALAGLFWLKEGVNTVGAGPEFDVRLTNNFKEGKFGEIDFHQGKATLQTAPHVEAEVDGKPVSKIDLVSDAEEKPTIVHTGSQLFYLIQRENRFGVRLKDSQSPARVQFKGQVWFPVEESYRVPARLEPFPAPKELLVPNVLGGHFKMKSPGLLKFTLRGHECTLQPVTEDNGSLFIIFRDATTGKETYDAGRFLHAEKPVHNDTVLDFNKAENPPCAFTPYATCPLPPPGNELAVAVEAGEKAPADHPQ